MKLDHLGEQLISSAAFAGVGVIVFGAAFWLITKITPFSIRKEIEEDHNVALGIILAGVLIGIAIIVGSAISG